ncbi:hypothetical protein [Leptospira interrogans]|nr:hypothetical protein [Leptospira interrogans]
MTKVENPVMVLAARFARIELVPTILEFVCKIVICGSSHILGIDL